MRDTKHFCKGQIVTPDFSGPRRALYNIIEDNLIQTSCEIGKNDFGIIIENYDDESNNVWVKVLMSTGLTGYVPSIWVKPL